MSAEDLVTAGSSDRLCREKSFTHSFAGFRWAPLRTPLMRPQRSRAGACVFIEMRNARRYSDTHHTLSLVIFPMNHRASARPEIGLDWISLTVVRKSNSFIGRLFGLEPIRRSDASRAEANMFFKHQGVVVPSCHFILPLRNKGLKGPVWVAPGGGGWGGGDARKHTRTSFSFPESKSWSD